MIATDANNAVERTPMQNSVVLAGLDGSNPVQFLAALGVLATLESADGIAQVNLSWRESVGAWRPVIQSNVADVSRIAGVLAKTLKCPFSPDSAAESLREVRQKAFDAKKKELKDALQDLKRKKLKGKARDEEFTKSVAPVQTQFSECRSQWLEALRQCVPSMEMSLGKHLNAQQVELREILQDAVREASIELLSICSPRSGQTSA